MLYQLEGLVCGDVIKRPSKLIKTPYVADVLLKDKEIIFRKKLGSQMNNIPLEDILIDLMKKIKLRVIFLVV